VKAAPSALVRPSVKFVGLLVELVIKTIPPAPPPLYEEIEKISLVPA
jgi:hypothetical protein